MKNEIYDFLKSCGTYYLATVDGDQPRVRPFGTIEIFEGKFYIQTGKVKKVSKEMKNNPKIEICAFNGKSWLRLEAKAYLDDRREARVHMLDSYPSLKKMYDPDDGNTEVFRLEEVKAVMYSFTEPAREIKL